jgi:hypothetical protein
LSRISTPVDIHAVAVFVPNEIILFKKTGLLLVKVIASVSLLIQEPVVEMLPYRITRLASGTFLFSSEKMAFFIPLNDRFQESLYHILKCPKKCLNSENALELSADCMEMILQSDELVLSEAEMFKFVLHYHIKKMVAVAFIKFKWGYGVFGWVSA